MDSCHRLRNLSSDHKEKCQLGNDVTICQQKLSSAAVGMRKDVRTRLELNYPWRTTRRSKFYVSFLSYAGDVPCMFIKGPSGSPLCAVYARYTLYSMQYKFTWI
jgi:hypothetical protein